MHIHAYVFNTEQRNLSAPTLDGSLGLLTDVHVLPQESPRP